MSLSFVSSAVQTGRSDGGYDEVQIESKEKEAVNRRNEHKPLFEQLRQNQEEEESNREEAQLQMMRGTCALDEDDVAYLDALEKQRLEKEREIQERTLDEVALFREARLQKQEVTLNDENDDEEDEIGGSIVPLAKNAKPVEAETSKAAVPAVKKGPVIVVKKRKRKGATTAETKKPKAPQVIPKEQPKEKKEDPKQEKAEKSNQGGLGGLLGGYGSSDDDTE